MTQAQSTLPIVTQKYLQTSHIPTIRNYQQSQTYVLLSANTKRKQQEEIEILLEHDDAVRTMVEEVSGLPFEVKQGVLLEVLNNPDKNIIELRNAMILRALGRPDMEWNNDLELVVSRLKTADPENVIQFFKSLSGTIAPHERS
jgi:hypothetical protein